MRWPIWTRPACGAWAADEYGGLCRTVDAYEYDEARAIAARLLARVSRPKGAWLKELSDSRVLIVDDVKANVDVLVQALRDDYKLSVALGGQQALDAVARSAPDLVLLDIMMPDVDGYEVCRRLRAAETTRELPIMFLSSLEDVKDKTLGFEVGGNDYLTKPFEVLEVKARVRSLLKAKAYADAIKAAAERDLRIASEIQMGLLPADVSGQVEGTGLEITPSSNRRAWSAAISTRCCGSAPTGYSSRSATSPAKAFPRRCSWRCR